ncbi:hypothetical protein EG339_16075 [Chryseobacterium bernardetii]|uniref:Uncharacterized protein n=1 Tax=Chryseobacterium bernardetii TaxID=1241978 RepID=A0A3G6TDH5_9FLAO|nr:hypothetical protein [Chryseobacterium bernardetii]AZB25997.1 hypothetical protein EG339_16075 [Chryseobacterium bernardetii]
MKEKNIIKEIIETGSEISGGVGGAIIGGLIAGPGGVVIGGASGPIFTKLFKVIGNELKSRFLGSREVTRVGAAYTYAINRIKENENKGLILRNDNFFGSEINNRPASEEVLEGILISSQTEAEELKIKFLGNLYANICFRSDISKAHANQLIKTANNLSFQQFCILQLFNEKWTKTIQFSDPQISRFEKWEISAIDIISETRDLQQKGLISIPATRDGGDNSAPISLINISITKIGRLFCEMLSLEEIDSDSLNKMNDLTSIRD